MSHKEHKSLTSILKQSAIRAVWMVIIVFGVYLLQGCGKKRLASVEERATNNSRVSVNYDDDYSAVDAKLDSYQVKAGDTLYSIAFRFGVDYNTLAKSNKISSNYLINVGQKLDIAAARAYKEIPTVTPPSSSAVSKPIISSRPISKPKPGNRPVATSSKPKQNQSKPKPSSVVKPTKPSPKYVDTNKPVKFWIWPNMGKIIRSFNQGGNKGIDIGGNIGDLVRASAAGRVVYAGKGLRGYGNLVIIKHNESFISAYAHNRKILVKENEIIKAGQKIAEIGSSDTDAPKLHFEIRYKGKPTNPLKYLPKR